MYWAFPSRLFDEPFSTILNDRNGNLISAQIADDGQWRFPMVEQIPKELETATLMYEDEYFRFHLGLNPVSVFRAIIQNFKHQKITSGGSTISMQVIRLSRKKKARTYLEKLIEMYLAFRMEWSFSKDDILKLYLSHAPYGGNVVGAETAAWRYFNRPLNQLSWAEYSMLAVLPNAPSLIHINKNRPWLKIKRDRLLKKLLEKDKIDSNTYLLAIEEPIPDRPSALPNQTYHLLEFAKKNGYAEQRIQTTIDIRLQNQLMAMANQYMEALAGNQIRNACILVEDISRGEILCYIGNTQNKNNLAPYVDLIQSERSSGSILKPFLYGLSFEEGLIYPPTLLEDIPISFGGFTPLNFNQRYLGVVPAKQALAQSLNIPAVNLLKNYGIIPFYDRLKSLGISSLHRPVGNYGLSLILGGAEVKLWDLASIYTKQAQVLNTATNERAPRGIRLFNKICIDSTFSDSISAGAWWLTSQALTQVQRPGLEEDWKRFSSSKKIAWKTGTSQGFRDAWAIGYTANYLVAVWVGNAEGDGRPGLTGVSAAAPLMFKCFQLLPQTHWFEKPEAQLKSIELCSESGRLPQIYCPKKTIEVPINSRMNTSCQYHEKILINPKGEQVFRHCSDEANKDTVWFKLPPIPAYYYKQIKPDFINHLPVSKACITEHKNEMAIIYPQQGAKIQLAKGFDGKIKPMVLEATHNNNRAKMYWHLDEHYLGMSESQHRITILINAGHHRLNLVDEQGHQVQVSFDVYE